MIIWMVDEVGRIYRKKWKVRFGTQIQLGYIVGVRIILRE